MNIEISEVFVHYTDSISAEPTTTAIGIAAIAPRSKRPSPKHIETAPVGTQHMGGRDYRLTDVSGTVVRNILA